MRRCTLCKQEKPLDDFPRDRTKKEGREYRCRECDRARQRARYAADPDKHAAYQREWVKQRAREKTSAKERRWRTETERGRKWYEAQKALKRALHNGVIIRPDACAECGTPCVPHAHHDDYDRPIDVRWLCEACHLAAHGKQKRNPTAVIDYMANRRAA